MHFIDSSRGVAGACVLFLFVCCVQRLFASLISLSARCLTSSLDTAIYIHFLYWCLPCSDGLMPGARLGMAAAASRGNGPRQQELGTGLAPSTPRTPAGCASGGSMPSIPDEPRPPPDSSGAGEAAAAAASPSPRPSRAVTSPVPPPTPSAAPPPSTAGSRRAPPAAGHDTPGQVLDAERAAGVVCSWKATGLCHRPSRRLLQSTSSRTGRWESPPRTTSGSRRSSASASSVFRAAPPQSASTMSVA